MAKLTGDGEDLALFRYSLIVPALNETYSEKSKNEYFKNIAEKEHKMPNGEKKQFSIATIKSWYYGYKRGGFNGIKRDLRKDKGFSKKIPISILDTVEEIRKTRPHITKREIYEKLCELGEIRKVDVAESTFYRFMKNSEKDVKLSRKRVQSL